MSEVQKFDPAQLMQGVRERVKATFVSLIPDEQWEQMIKKECDDFFTRNSRYSDYNAASPFSILCREELANYASHTEKSWIAKKNALPRQLH